MTVPEPYFKLTLNGKDATKDLSPFVMSITYTDNLTGTADELTVTLDNSDKRFLNEWYMSPGMIVQFWIGQLNCGTFTIDNPSESCPPHTVEFRAQSAEFAGPIRSPNSFSHYKKTLANIVGKYAKDYGWKVVGNTPNLTLNTIVQMRISDIDFLHNLAKTYGCVCSLKGKNLVFDSIENIWNRAASRTIHFADVMTYHFETSLPETADASVSNYYDPYTDTVIGAILTPQDKKAFNPQFIQKYTGLPTKEYNSNPSVQGQNYTNWDQDYDGKSNNIRVIYKKAENPEEATRLALGELATKKNKKHLCNMTVPGNELLVAGNAINVLEFGKRSGYWLINRSMHKITKHGGWTTNIDLIHGAATTGAKAPPPVVYVRPINAYSPDTTGGGNNAP